ncbi:hypothetical protein [Burkholderia ubonensis]|uniref:hypothetical protein n=1 Tax=Burkholderia ubonensis TaxID=101571 RepID=UPI000AD83AE5|nr:hypothetical protein [Burkholderia ubonensis]
MFTTSRLSANAPIVNTGFELGQAEGGSSIQHNSPQRNIVATSQVIDDLGLFCDEILSESMLGAGRNLDSNYAKRVIIPRAEEWAYNQYRACSEKIEALSRNEQTSILKSIIHEKPERLRLTIQGMDAPLTETLAEEIEIKPENSLVITGNFDGFSEHQEGRLSLKLNPGRYQEAFSLLCLLKDRFPEEVSHSKIMLPSVVGAGPEDAVVYVNDFARADDIAKEFSSVEGLVRPSDNGIFFMDEVSAGIYKGSLPREAYTTDDGGAAGSLGLYFSKLAVRAAAYSLEHSVTSRDAVEHILEQAGFNIEK